jgi:hypothetical protein
MALLGLLATEIHLGMVGDLVLNEAHHVRGDTAVRLVRFGNLLDTPRVS